ncbi:MAG: FAD-dependent oxidoreductase [Coriobacteriia bacterium]|nr:FAD-dependent oxidoreductase [Coriobacteriia bacterium]
MKRYDYLILGNSAAAIAAVEAIRETDKRGSVLMVSPEPYPAYGTPLISYVLEGKIAEENMWLRPSSFYEDLQVETLFGLDYAATAIDAHAHEVTLLSGESIRYGKLLVATGSTPTQVDIPGLAGAKNAVNFLTLDQAKQAGSMVDAATEWAHAEGRKSRVMVLGGGLIGMKAAEALSFHADEVVVYKRSFPILDGVLDLQAGALLSGLVEPHGIICRPGATASKFDVVDGSITHASLTDGTELDVDFVVVAVGVRPNSFVAVAAGAEEGRGLVVDKRMHTSLPDVYAAGDVTQTTNVLDGTDKPLALWPNAVRQGRIAGAQMAGNGSEGVFVGNFAVNATNFFGEVSLLTAGIVRPKSDQGFEERVFVEGDRYRKFVIKNDRLYGFILMNAPEAAGIYSFIIDKKIPLSSLGEDLFSGAPGNLSFKNPDLQWFRMHVGYPHELDRKGRGASYPWHEE